MSGLLTATSVKIDARFIEWNKRVHATRPIRSRKLYPGVETPVTTLLVVPERIQLALRNFDWGQNKREKYLNIFQDEANETEHLIKTKGTGQQSLFVFNKIMVNKKKAFSSWSGTQTPVFVGALAPTVAVYHQKRHVLTTGEKSITSKLVRTSAFSDIYEHRQFALELSIFPVPI